MPTKVFNAVKSAVLADLQENNLACYELEELIFAFLGEVRYNAFASKAVNTAEEWDSLELHDMQQL
jgi:hypothetical protein